MLTCQYCGNAAVLRMSSAHLYQGHDYGPVWECMSCDAYVGCHPDTAKPLGTLANKELRNLRRQVKDVFNPLWEDVEAAYPGIVRQRLGWIRHLMRTRAYAWLAEQMALTKDECHVGMFDLAKCRRAINIIKTTGATAGRVRTWAKDRETREARAS